MQLIALASLSLSTALLAVGASAAPRPSATRSFFAAIEAGNQSTVEAMLRRDPALAAARGPGGATDGGETPLGTAVRKGKTRAAA